MPKLPQGVTRRKDGSLEKRFTVDGKRYSVYAHTVKELQQKELAKRQEIEAHSYKKNTKVTLDEYFKEWLEQKSRSAKPSTVQRYTMDYTNHIKEILGKRKVVDIERREVMDMTKKIQASTSIYMANYCLMLINGILNGAVNDEIIDKNPAARIPKIKETGKKPASETIHRALTREEQRAFLNALDGEYYREFLELILLTGMRYGECAALTWADIDQTAGVIRITKTQTYGKNSKRIISDSPKSAAGRREIPINKAIKDVLKRQRQKMIDLYGLQGILPEKPIFCSVYGHMIQCGAIYCAIVKAIKKMEANGFEIEHFSVHALRDTFATRYIEAGGSPQTLKTILGHSSLKMTMDLYAHVLPNTKAEEMNRISII